jgi:hypothetical protein
MDEVKLSHHFLLPLGCNSYSAVVIAIVSLLVANCLMSRLATCSEVILGVFLCISVPRRKSKTVNTD